MNQKISVILFIVVILALGLILYQYSGKEQPGPQEQGQTEEGETEEGETEETTSTKENIDDIISEAIRNQDISVCEKIEDENVKKCVKLMLL